MLVPALGILKFTILVDRFFVIFTIFSVFIIIAQESSREDHFKLSTIFTQKVSLFQWLYMFKRPAIGVSTSGRKYNDPYEWMSRVNVGVTR